MGCNEDPYFGKTEIGLYVNANTNLSGLDFGDKSKILSAEIILAFDENLDYTGSLEAPLTYSVYAVDSLLYSSRQYYTSNDRLHPRNILLSETKLSYIEVDEKKIVRIPIDPTYAGTLMKDNAYLASNDLFQLRYRGFYIKAANQPGSEGLIYKCNLEADWSGFYLHYRADTTGKDSTYNFRFSFSGASSVKFNTVKRDLTKAHPYYQNQAAGDTAAGSKNLFLKGMGINKIRVYVPDLVKFADTFDVAVNRAELIFYPDLNFAAGADYVRPSRLTLLALDSLGREMYTEDQLNATDYARYDGTYDADNFRYVFNIARHAQAIVNKEIKNYGFNLIVANSDQTLANASLAKLFIRSFPTIAVKRDDYNNRVVFAGSDDAGRKPRFNLSYIKFKKD